MTLRTRLHRLKTSAKTTFTINRMCTIVLKNQFMMSEIKAPALSHSLAFGTFDAITDTQMMHVQTYPT